jgi:hypothetical protein
MVFKEMVAYLLDGKGGYTCSDDIGQEKHLYLGFQNLIQQSIDHARQMNPDWTEERLNQYAYGDSIGQIFLKTKDCLASHGYDMSTLPQLTVPEFGDVASLIFKIGMAGATMAGIYAAKYMASKKNFGKV